MVGIRSVVFAFGFVSATLFAIWLLSLIIFVFGEAETPSDIAFIPKFILFLWIPSFWIWKKTATLSA